jgi:hypothetical protein
MKSSQFVSERAYWKLNLTKRKSGLEHKKADFTAAVICGFLLLLVVVVAVVVVAVVIVTLAAVYFISLKNH